MHPAMKLRSGTPEEVGMSPRRIQHVRELAAGWVADGMHPALVVLVARRGVIVLHEAFGKLTNEPDSPALQADSIFPLASLTKPVTATAVMFLVEDGLIGLNRPVQDYIPEFEGDGKADVLVHHLLTHTSDWLIPMIRQRKLRTSGGGRAKETPNWKLVGSIPGFSTNSRKPTQPQW